MFYIALVSRAADIHDNTHIVEIVYTMRYKFKTGIDTSDLRTILELASIFMCIGNAVRSPGNSFQFICAFLVCSYDQ